MRVPGNIPFFLIGSIVLSLFLHVGVIRGIGRDVVKELKKSKRRGQKGRRMHTDEYEISLSRELDICKKKIEEIEKFLAAMEKRYGIKTGSFVEGFVDGKIVGHRDDFTSWKNHSEELKKWRDRKKEYETIFHMMKI